MNQQGSLPDFKSDEVSEWGYGNVPLPSEPTLAENAGPPAMETELWSTSEFEWPQSVDEPGNCAVIQYPGAPIVSEHADLQSRPDISGTGNMMMQPNYFPVVLQQDGVREIGLQSTTTTGFHPSSSSNNAISYTGFLNRPTFPSRQRENYIMREIGMHSTSSGVGAAAERDGLSRLGKNCLSTMSHEDSKNHHVASITANQAPLLSENTRHMNSFLPFKPVDIGDQLVFNFGNADSTDNFTPSSPKIKKTKLLNPDGGNGSKRCNCIKSRCLKLYCECFAARVHCSDSCACQGCSNRIEHKDIVHETAEKIKSQNLHAFSKKITEPSTNNSGEDGVHHKPRHKTGCTCKKSRCSQKYCECFQFGVGCSDRCRCEGCQNAHGRKEDYNMNRNLVSKHDHNDNNEILSGENELRMSPSTPSIPIPYPNNGETAPRSSWIPQVTNIQYLSSQEMVMPNINNGINSFEKLEYGSQHIPNNVLAEFDRSILLSSMNSSNMLEGQIFPNNHVSSTFRYNSHINSVTHPERININILNDTLEMPTPSPGVTSHSNMQCSPFGMTSRIGSTGSRGGVMQQDLSFSPSTPRNDFEDRII